MNLRKRTRTLISNVLSSSQSRSTDIAHRPPSNTPSKTHKTGKRMGFSKTGSSVIRGQGQTSPRVTIRSLPDNVLLDIFESYLVDHWPKWVSWFKLVHVCQRWRYIMFASPLRLDLRLLCTERTPVRKTLDVWPPFPIEILCYRVDLRVGDNIIAALEHPNRVRRISLGRISTSLDRLVEMMQVPFPAMVSLTLVIEGPGGTVPPLPSTFLGGSAPHLRSLTLDGIPFPTIPRLLLSSNHLADLHLLQIPHSGYISPEAMATCISALTNLANLSIGFESPTSRPDPGTRRPPPLTRDILPALTKLSFHGVSEYLEDLVAWIDAPLLNSVNITFFNQLVFGIQQLHRVIVHAPTLMSCEMAWIDIYDHHVEMSLMSKTVAFRCLLTFKISCREIDWQVSSVAQIGNQLSETFISRIDDLIIRDTTRGMTFEDFMDEAQWLELFHPFIAVRSLEFLSKTTRMGSHVVSALRGLTGESVTQVLPALDNLNIYEEDQASGSEQQDIEPFLIARQSSDHPVIFYRGKE